MPFKSLSEKCHFKGDADEKNTCLKLTVTLLICLFFCGCQTGPTDEELINTTMNSWKQAIIAQDIDAIMEYYSENFSAQEAEDKEGMRELMEEAIEKGLLENIDINLETAQLTITDDTAPVVSPQIACFVIIPLWSKSARFVWKPALPQSPALVHSCILFNATRCVAD